MSRWMAIILLLLFWPNALWSQGGWYTVATGTTANLFSVTFASSQAGWACGSSGTLIKTTDGGSTWYAVNTGTSEELISVDFVNEQSGFAAGANGVILKTTDGGLNWTPSPSGTTVILESIRFQNPDSGYVAGHGLVLKTTNGGLSWFPSFSNGSDSLTCVQYRSASDIMAAGYSGKMIRSTNAGREWFVVPTPTVQNLEGLAFSSEETGFAVGLNGTLIRTTDGGDSWQSVVSGVSTHLLAIDFSDSGDGVIVGQSGTLLRTTDGGTTWFSQSSFSTDFITHVVHLAAGEAIVVGFGGKAAKTEAGFTAFSKVTSGPIVNDGGASRSVNWVDYNNDGFPDLFVSNSNGAIGRRDFLYRNNGPDSNYTFAKITSDPVVLDNGRSDGASFGDYDNDGDLDLFVVNWYGENNMLYENNGFPNFTFTKITTGPPVSNGGLSETCVWGDYDNDGDLDLYVTNSGNAGIAYANFLYKNNGDKTFTRITTGIPVTDVTFSRGATWMDFDQDGDIDLFVTNEEGQNNALYRNMLVETATDTFARVTGDPLVSDGLSSMGASWGDVDNDGDQDVFVANAPNNNRLYLQNNDHTFTEVATGAIVADGGVSFGSGWGDMDNDGDLDLYVVNAYAGTPVVNFLYKNLRMESGTVAFERVGKGLPATETGYAFGIAWGDYDRDGDLDLFLAKTWSENENNALFNNENANGNHWLEIRVVGVQSNRTGIGARIRVKATINGQSVWQQRVIEGQSGYCGQNLWAHFGLGDATVIDSVIVDWPSGLRSVHESVAPDRLIQLYEDGTISSNPATVKSRRKSLNLYHNYPNPFNPSTTIRFELPSFSFTRLTVYDVLGRYVDTLVEGTLPAGAHDIQWTPSGLASGIYIIRLQAAGESAARCVVLIK